MNDNEQTKKALRAISSEVDSLIVAAEANAPKVALDERVAKLREMVDVVPRDEDVREIAETLRKKVDLVQEALDHANRLRASMFRTEASALLLCVMIATSCLTALCLRYACGQINDGAHPMSVAILWTLLVAFGACTTIIGTKVASVAIRNMNATANEGER